MVFLTVSAAFSVGLIHSLLAPAHWLPIILVAKSRRWDLKRTLFGALVASSGHFVLSVVLGVLAITLGAEFISRYDHAIEKWAGIGLILFGLAYAVLSFFWHIGCHGHPEEKQAHRDRAPFLFLLSLGFSPCIAVLPVFVAAAGSGVGTVVLTMVAFGLGVIVALFGATSLVSLGIAKVDHPIFTHHGDFLSGIAVALFGMLFLLLPHSH